MKIHSWLVLPSLGVNEKINLNFNEMDNIKDVFWETDKMAYCKTDVKVKCPKPHKNYQAK